MVLRNALRGGGGPSQLETFDHKPLLQERNGEQLPDSVRQGQRLTGMLGNQSLLPLAGAQFEFAQHGESGLWGSGFLPARHQGVQFRAGKNPVLYLSDPPGIDEDARKPGTYAANCLQARRLAERGVRFI